MPLDYKHDHILSRCLINVESKDVNAWFMSITLCGSLYHGWFVFMRSARLGLCPLLCIGPLQWLVCVYGQQGLVYVHYFVLVRQVLAGVLPL